MAGRNAAAAPEARALYIQGLVTDLYIQGLVTDLYIQGLVTDLYIQGLVRAVQDLRLCAS